MGEGTRDGGAAGKRGDAMWFLGRLTSATTTIFLSFVLATVSIVFIGITHPGWISVIQDWSDVVEDWLTHTALPEKYNVWIRFLVDDTTFVVMFFTILARLVIAIFLTGLGALFGTRDEPTL
jgi:hypothetical protein